VILYQCCWGYEKNKMHPQPPRQMVAEARRDSNEGRPRVPRKTWARSQECLETKGAMNIAKLLTVPRGLCACHCC
jgi:hypothetical protein